MENFMSDGVCKDVIDSPPADELKVHYPASGKNIRPGMVVTPTQVKDKPQLTFKADPSSFYTLIMHDPDAPSRKDPKFGEYQHWLVINIPGGDVSKGEEITGYIGSGAPKNTGLHRYVFLIYKQKEKIAELEDSSKIPATQGKGRAQQKVRDLVKKLKLGELVAGNFFKAEWDEYVPELHKSLKN